MFVSLEGIDGAGKTTLCDILQSRLPNALVLRKKELQNHSPISIRHKIIRLHDEIWSNESGSDDFVRDRPLSDIFLMAGWFHLIDEHVIRPCLEMKRTIILDGWFYKFLCRFKGRDRHELSLLESMLNGLTNPSVGVYLDVSPQTAARRKKQYTASECGVLDGYGMICSSSFIEYQSSQKQVFDEIARFEKWKILNSEKFSPDQLADEIIDVLGSTVLNGTTE